MSVEPSPAQSRSATLPRKPSTPTNPMAGRPLPPPPPPGSKTSPPPPALPKKSASVTQMSRYPASPGHRSSQPGIPMPGHTNRYPPAQPQYPQYPPHNPLPYPPQQQAYPGSAAQANPYPLNNDWNTRGQSSYLDEMRAAPEVSQ